MTIIDGQISIFDLLNPARPRREALADDARVSLRARQQLNEFSPTLEQPVHCAMCGKQLHGHFDYSVNHTPLGWLGDQRMCTAMNLTRNHVAYAGANLVKGVAGEPTDQCCWDIHGLHGKAVRKPTVMQLADHLRWQIEHTRNTWGVRGTEFDSWLGQWLIGQRIFRYSLDPAEYPEEFEGEK